MADFGYFSQKIGSSFDRILCETLQKREQKLPSGRFVSFCFDDFPKSAAKTAAPMLEQRGWRATWYVAGGFLGKSEDEYGAMFDARDLKRLRDQGHDFGCHTFDHIDCRTATAEELADQCARNTAFLAEHDITDCDSFAYPFGAVDLVTKKTFASSDMAFRGVKPGLNRGVIDLNMLKACGLQNDNGGTARALRDLETLKNGDGWLIIFTHDVRERPSPWGVSPEDFENLCDAVTESGAEVVTVGDMVQRMQRASSLLAHYKAA